MRASNPSQKSQAHDAHTVRMRILSMRNDSSELNLAGANALGSTAGNAKRGMLGMMILDGPQHKDRVNRKSRIKARKRRMQHKHPSYPEISLP